jgi:hypothetical protein
MKSICIVIFLFWVISSSVFAADIYVRSGAAGDGSQDNPMGYLWKALDKALRGDVIHVAIGVYQGKGGSGAFLIKVPDLTLVGGYDSTFTNRNPFTNMTILQRDPEYRGSATGLPEGIIGADEATDHTNLTVDGFVINSATRNGYKADGDIDPMQTWRGSLIQTMYPNFIIRNCILLNPYNDAIYVKWQGDKNEISNCFIVNPFYSAISMTSAQDGSVVTVKNNTVAFVWEHPTKYNGVGMTLGKKGKTIIKDNVFMFLQSAGVYNGYGNDKVELSGNIFFQAKEGYYKFMDYDGQNLVLWNNEQLNDMNNDPESYMLIASGGNSDTDPQLKPDSAYFEKWSNFVASEPGKLNMDLMNQWRSSVGLNLVADAASPRKNWGMEYPYTSVIPNLDQRIPGKGASSQVNFMSYQSASGSASLSSETESAPAKEYKQIDFSDFSSKASSFKGAPVMFKAGMGGSKYTWLLSDFSKEQYLCWQILKPGEKETTRDYIFGYILKGSPADKAWQKYARNKKDYQLGGTLTFKGTAYYFNDKTYPYPVAVVIEEIEE